MHILALHLGGLVFSYTNDKSRRKKKLSQELFMFYKKKLNELRSAVENLLGNKTALKKKTATKKKNAPKIKAALRK